MKYTPTNFPFDASTMSGFLGLSPRADTWSALFTKFGNKADMISSIAINSEGDGNQFDNSVLKNMDASSLRVGVPHFTSDEDSNQPAWYALDKDSNSFLFKNFKATLTKDTGVTQVPETAATFDKITKICVQTNNNFMIALDNTVAVSGSTMY
jgi:hypothetical protein